MINDYLVRPPLTMVVKSIWKPDESAKIENSLRTLPATFGIQRQIATKSHNAPRRGCERLEKVTAGTVNMAAAYLTHQQKVLRLYKKSLRHLESWCIYR